MSAITEQTKRQGDKETMRQGEGNLRLLLVPLSTCLLVSLFLVTGCAQPTLVHTRAELVQNLGKKIAVEGTYQVTEAGEHVRAGDVDVALDSPQDILGFGRPPLTNGSQVRASGTVERGAMALGVFIDEQTLALSRGRAENPIVPGFVLRDAKVQELKIPATQPSPQGRQ